MPSPPSLQSRRAGEGLQKCSPRVLLPEKSRKEKFTRRTNSAIQHILIQTSIHTLTLKGGGVSMAAKKPAAKKPAAKKPAKKAAKKK
mgnify:CR=1 FL=1